MSLPFVEENAKSRQRLEVLAARLTEQDLVLTTSYGWTIAALLAHLAFWDQRMIAILRRWKESGFDESPIDSAAINDALKPLCNAITPRIAVELSMSSARMIDDELETLTSEFYEQIQKQVEATSTQFRFIRALHRNDHLNDIEALINES